MNHSELAKFIISTAKEIEDHCPDNYTTEQLNFGIPAYELELLQLRFFNLMETFKGIQFFDISNEEDLMNWFTIAGYETIDTETAINISDKRNMC